MLLAPGTGTTHLWPVASQLGKEIMDAGALFKSLFLSLSSKKIKSFLMLLTPVLFNLVIHDDWVHAVYIGSLHDLETGRGW